MKFEYYYSDDEIIEYSFEKPLSDFFSNEKQNEEICKWFIEKIELINGLKSSSALPWK